MCVQQWDCIEIEEETDDDRIVKSNIRVPMQVFSRNVFLSEHNDIFSSALQQDGKQGIVFGCICVCVVSRTCTKLGERAFSVSGPVAWNALPATIRNTTDSKLFKRLLKVTFLNRSFDITA